MNCRAVAAQWGSVSAALVLRRNYCAAYREKKIRTVQVVLDLFSLWLMSHSARTVAAQSAQFEGGTRDGEGGGIEAQAARHKERAHRSDQEIPKRMSSRASY
jgi:hypothetical protein